MRDCLRLADAKMGTGVRLPTGSTPAAWDPWTPIGVLLTQHVLFGSLGDKLWRDRVRRVAPAAWDLLCGPRHASVTPAPTSVATRSRPAGATPGRLREAAPGLALPFVVGDPHRMLELPGVYQQVRLACPEFDVVGLAFAGVPGTPHFAHAGDVAWGITNAMSDCHDVFVEDLRRTDSGVEARGADGWAAVQAHRELVLVRGGDDVEVEVVETARGLVVVGNVESDRPLSVRMVPRVEGDAGLTASLALLRSRSAEDVRAAWRGWVEPVNAVLTADRTGTVLEFTAGLVPDRAAANREGPVPGWDAAHSWTGYLDHAEADVPGVAVHANHATRHTSPLGRDFASPDRARRIAELLGTTAASGRRRPAARSTPTPSTDRRAASCRCSQTLGGLSAPAASLRDELLAWDCRMDADSSLAHRYAVLRAALVASLCRVDAFAGLRAASDLPHLYDPWMSLALRVSVRLESFLTEPPDGFDVTAELASALEAAAEGARRRVG